MEIRPARVDEIPAVEQLFQQIVAESTYYNEWAKRSELARYTQEKLAQMIAAAAESVLIARVIEAGPDEQPAGFCFSHNDGMGLIWLGWLGVAPGFRRRGVAELLVKRLTESANARGAHKIWCDTRVGNKPAESFFQNSGFAQLCEIRKHWYGLDYYLWQKEV